MPFDSTPISSPLVDLLRKGRANIEKGWCQGALYRNGSVCLIGAVALERFSDDIRVLRRIPFGDGLFLEARGVLETIISRRNSITGWRNSITGWNDTTGRTKEQVLAVYDEAIEIAIEKALTKE